MDEILGVETYLTTGALSSDDGALRLQKRKSETALEEEDHYAPGDNPFVVLSKQVQPPPKKSKGDLVEQHVGAAMRDNEGNQGLSRQVCIHFIEKSE